jgi:ABC-type uncharacterized transport system auxiliary subunit
MQKFIIIVMGSSVLCACGMLSPVVTPEIKQYQIISAASAAASCKPNPSLPILQVSPVRVFAPYDTRNMYYSESQYQLNAYALNQWAANPSWMFTQSIFQRLQQSCIYGNVVSAEFMITAKYRLTSQVMDFKQVINGTTASMNLNIVEELVDNSTNQVLRSKTFIETSQVEANPAGYIKGANDVMDSFLSDLTTWLGSN